MVFADIEKLKQKYTDQYVIVDGERPELARFRDLVGRVKTVNMSGRALVEFADYHLNIGWFDIDLDFLKVVDKPLPKAEKPEAKKPAAQAQAADKAPAKPTPAAPAKPAAGKSTADILAAARGGASAPPKAAGAKSSTADILAAARGGAAKPAAAAPTKPAAAPAKPPSAAPASVDRSKMSVADMLAAARAGGSGGAASTTPAAEPAPAETPAIEKAAAAPVVITPPEPQAAAPRAAKTSEKVDRSKMTIDEMIAWCREHDSK